MESAGGERASGVIFKDGWMLSSNGTEMATTQEVGWSASKPSGKTAWGGGCRVEAAREVARWARGRREWGARHPGRRRLAGAERGSPRAAPVPAGSGWQRRPGLTRCGAYCGRAGQPGAVSEQSAGMEERAGGQIRRNPSRLPLSRSRHLRYRLGSCRNCSAPLEHCALS